MWWRTHREATALFQTELDAALALLARFPGAGPPAPSAKRPWLRRFYVAPLSGHLYYTVDGDVLMIRAWRDARRQHGPRL